MGCLDLRVALAGAGFAVIVACLVVREDAGRREACVVAILTKRVCWISEIVHW